MPYIKQSDRVGIDSRTRLPQTAGELNYAITRLILTYADQPSNGPFNYQKINDIIGALEGAKQEFYRRRVGPYEDKKIIENGDVYE